MPYNTIVPHILKLKICNVLARCEVPMHLVGVSTAPVQQPRTGQKHIIVFMCVRYANLFAQMYA